MPIFPNPTQQINDSIAQPSPFNSTFKLLFALYALLFPLLLLANIGHCESIILAWDPNSPNENIAGYKLYIGIESRSYSTVIDVANSTSGSIEKPNLGEVYYLAVTAYNSEGEESGFSEELVISGCTYKLSKSKKNFRPTGGVGKVKVITQSNCEWTAASGASWLAILEGESGKGKGYITYSVDANPDPVKRVGGSSFAGKMHTITQKGTRIAN